MAHHARIRLAVLPFLLLGTTGTGCRAPAPGTDPPDAPEVTDPDTAVQAPPEVKPIRIPAELSDPNRWLVVQRVREGKRGAWATGDFDAERNKLTIKTHDVQQFALHLSRININWERLVILGINGRNSELKKRDYSPIHVARDDHGQWVVVEP